MKVLTKVPFLDVRASYIELQQDIDEALQHVLASGSYLLGPELDAFEAEYARYVGAKHCIGVGTGLDALQFALRAVGVEAGDEVIVPSNTFIATWLAVSHLGAKPVPVEPDERSFNLDANLLRNAITKRTKAVVPVHLYGQPADMDRVLQIASEFGLYVIEDAAQAHGAKYRQRRVGAFGHAAGWSFYPAKNLGAFSDGGAVTTNDDQIADKVRLLRNYGSRHKYNHEVQGSNSRLDEIQSAVLRIKLRHLDAWNERRKHIASLYFEALQDFDLLLPFVPVWADPVWHLFVVRSRKRDALRDSLREAGIDSLVHYPIPPHLQGAFADAAMPEGSLPISERLHREVLSLPIGPHLTTREATLVIQAIRASASAPKLSV